MTFFVVWKYSDLDLTFLRKCFDLNLSDTSALFCAPRQNVIFALYLSIFSFEAIFLVPVEASWRKKYNVLEEKVVQIYIFLRQKTQSEQVELDLNIYFFVKIGPAYVYHFYTWENGSQIVSFCISAHPIVMFV